MKSKTIKAILSKLHKELVESITDDKVKGMVEANSIISGGCIPSMLLREDVNDYDFYFTNKETAVAVAEYYLAKFIEANPKYLGTKVWVNGDRIEFSNGSRSVYGEAPTEEDTIVVEGTKEDKPKFFPVFLTSNSITLTNKVQLILRFYGTPEEIHSNYDFVHATSYWLSSDNSLVLPQAALESILSKELIYIGSKYPICSIFRTKKFIQRQWTVNAGQFLKMIWQAHELELSDIDVLRDQLVGVDSAYFYQVIDYLKKASDKAKDEGQNFKVDKTYLFEIINRIF